MKKIVFKKWLDTTIRVITALAMMLMLFEHTSLRIMMVKTIICSTIIFTNIKLLEVYGRGED